MRIVRIVVALTVAILVVGLFTKAFSFVINAVVLLMLYGFTESETAFRNVEAGANIVGLLGAVYVASRCYSWITRDRAKHVLVTDTTP